MKKQNQNIIVANSLLKKFNNVAAVNHITFSVKKGEIFGFLGPNGAGKTTTIRMLTGLIIQDSGDAFIDGIDIKKNPIKAKSKMGVIPELGNVYVDLTPKQNIILSGRFYGFPRKELEKRTEDLLKLFELYERRDDLVKTFSKGMQQRVNIASAIVHDPEILFLDEPTSGLDVQSQRLIRNIIKKMNDRGVTIFLTTHNIEEANILCTRVGVINKGKIAAIDTPERLKKTFDETRSVEISFNKLFDIGLIENGELVNRIEKLGDKLKIYTDNPDKLIKYVAGFAEDQNLAFTSLEICGASLEDIFVKLTSVHP